VLASVASEDGVEDDGVVSVSVVAVVSGVSGVAGVSGVFGVSAGGSAGETVGSVADSAVSVGVGVTTDDGSSAVSSVG